MDFFLTMLEWIWPTVSATEISNLQYALSTMAQAYAAVLGILLTIGLAFTQFGEYRIPLPLLFWLTWPERGAVSFALFTLILPVVFLSYGILAGTRVCLVLFTICVIALPFLAMNIIQRTRPSFYVQRLLYARKGNSIHGDSVTALAIQAADKGDWRTLEMMVALLGQLKGPFYRGKTERGWGYQLHMPKLFQHLIENDNEKGLRTLFGIVSYGACIEHTNSILHSDDTLSAFGRWLRFVWMTRPEWAHRVEWYFKRDRPILRIHRSYDYLILMQLRGLVLNLIYHKEMMPGDIVLPIKVSSYKEWAQMLVSTILSAYTLDEASKEDPRLPKAEPALGQVKSFVRLLGTVNARMLRDAVLQAPIFPGKSVNMFPLHFPKDLQEEYYADAARSYPMRARAANRLSVVAAMIQSQIHPQENAILFWPVWHVDGRTISTHGHRHPWKGASASQ